MIELIDINKEEETYRIQKEKGLWIFFGLTAFLLVAVFLLIYLSSPDNYLASEIISIVGLTVFIWFTLYYFSVPYRRLKKMAAFYAAAKSGNKCVEEITVEEVMKESELTKDGIQAQRITAAFEEGGKTYPRDLYVIQGSFYLEKGMRIKAETFSSVLLAYEVLK